MELYKYTAELSGVSRELLSVYPPAKVKTDGLNSASVVGYLKDPAQPLTADNMEVNPHFVRLIHEIVSSTIPKTPDFLAAVEAQQIGRISVLDQRVPDGQVINPEDVIGHYEIEDGVIVENYKPNPRYQLVSPYGVFKFEPEIEKALLEDIENSI